MPAAAMTRRPPSPGEEKLIEGIREVVREVTDPRFNTLEARFNNVDAKLAEIISRLPPAPPPSRKP